MVGCEDGQEGHLSAMAAEVEGRIESIKALGGQSGESRLLMLAALLMADELHDLRAEADSVRAAAAAAATRPARKGNEAEAQRRMAKLASRAEQIADTLTQA